MGLPQKETNGSRTHASASDKLVEQMYFVPSMHEGFVLKDISAVCQKVMDELEFPIVCQARLVENDSLSDPDLGTVGDVCIQLTPHGASEYPGNGESLMAPFGQIHVFRQRDSKKTRWRGYAVVPSVSFVNADGELVRDASNRDYTLSSALYCVAKMLESILKRAE